MKNKRKEILQEIIDRKDLDSLRSFSFQPGGFLNNELRSKAWDLLLRTDSDLELEYDQSPLDAELLHQIEVDVNRSFINFKSEENKQILKEKLNRTLQYIFKRFRWLNYYQGFHSICSVFIMVQGEQSAKKSLSILSTVWLRDYMEPTMSSTINHMKLVMKVLQKADFKLFGFLNSIPDFDPIFCVAWVLTWFSHHLEWQDSARLFDCLISSRPEFVIFVSAAIILQQEQQIMGIEGEMSDFFMVLKDIKFQHMDLELLLKDAKEMYDTHDIDTSSLGYYSAVNTYYKFVKMSDGEKIPYKTLEDYVQSNVSKPNRSKYPKPIMIIGIISVLLGISLIFSAEIKSKWIFPSLPINYFNFWMIFSGNQQAQG